MMISSFDARINVLSKSSAYGKVWPKCVRRSFSVMFPREHSSVAKTNLCLVHGNMFLSVQEIERQKNNNDNNNCEILQAGHVRGKKKKKRKERKKRQHPTTHNTIKILTYKKKLKGLHMIGKLKDKLITLSTEWKKSRLAKLKAAQKCRILFGFRTYPFDLFAVYELKIK